MEIPLTTIAADIKDVVDWPDYKLEVRYNTLETDLIECDIPRQRTEINRLMGLIAFEQSERERMGIPPEIFYAEITA